MTLLLCLEEGFDLVFVQLDCLLPDCVVDAEESTRLRLVLGAKTEARHFQSLFRAGRVLRHLYRRG